MKRAILLGTMLLMFTFIFAGSLSTSYAVDLKLTKTVNNTAPNLGDRVNFTVMVNNTDPYYYLGTAYNVRVTDRLPSTNLTYVSHSASQGTYNPTTGLWDVGTLRGAGTFATLNITAIVNVVGTTTNTANGSCTFDWEDHRASATINVPPAADLRITKTVNNTTPNFGQTVIFRLNVTNAGPSTATNVRVTDLLPAGLIYQSSNASPGTSYNNVTGLWTIGNLNNGATVSLNITALVNQTGSITNTGNVSGNQYDQNLTNNRANATVNVPPAADIRVTKVVNNSSPNYLDLVTFTVTVTNAGPNTGVNTRVSDLLPAGFGLVSANPSVGSYDNGTGLWSVGDLANGASATLQLVAQILASNTTLTNIANGSSNIYDWNLTNNNGSASVTVPPAADVAITKTVNNSTPNYLGNIIFTISVTNNGPDNATNVYVRDIIPAGLELDFFGITVIGPWNQYGYYSSQIFYAIINSLPRGVTTTFNLPVLVNTSNVTLSNTANVTANEYDWNTTNNNSTVSIMVPPAADVVVTKVVNNSAPNYLDNVTFTVTVTNNGPNNAINVRVSDLLPAGFGLVSASPSVGSYDNVTGLWSVGDLADGASATLQLVAQILASNTTLTNLANGSSDIYDWNLTNNNGSASVTVPPAADIVVTKSVNNTTPNYLDNVTFTVIVRNNGPDDATGVSLDDLLPAGLSWVSDDSSGSYDPVTGVWTIGGLANGASVTLNIVAQVLGHNTIIDNVANASALEFDPNLANNRANVTINVPAAADIAVTKTVNNATPNYLGNVVFTVTVQNNGPDDATGVKLSDLLPAGLVWVSDNPSQGSYDHVTGIWDIGDLYMEQGPVTLTITAMVNKTGNITNVANGSSDYYDWNLTNNVANATVSIPQTSELVLSKTVDKAKVVVGSTVKYTITVVNNGPDAAFNTVVTDILPSGMQYLSSIASTGSYDPNTGLWTIGTMANGAAETLEIFVKVLATGTYENIATVSSSSSNPGSNSSGVVIDVIRNGTNGTNGSGTVPMQHTGVPIALLAFALVMMVAGIAIPKRK